MNEECSSPAQPQLGFDRAYLVALRIVRCASLEAEVRRVPAVRDGRIERDALAGVVLAHAVLLQTAALDSRTSSK